MRYLVLPIAVAAIAVGGAVDHAGAADAGAEYRPVAAPLLLGCYPEWRCGTWGCGWRRFCSRRGFLGPSPYHWQAPAIAAYDDAWCRYYGPRGSPVYLQCRENVYYERASLPLRAIK